MNDPFLHKQFQTMGILEPCGMTFDAVVFAEVQLDL